MEQKSLFYSEIKVQSSSKSNHSYSSSLDGMLFQLHLFPKIVAVYLLFLYSTSSYSQKLSKGTQSKAPFRRCRYDLKTEQKDLSFIKSRVGRGNLWRVTTKIPVYYGWSEIKILKANRGARVKNLFVLVRANCLEFM